MLECLAMVDFEHCFLLESLVAVLCSVVVLCEACRAPAKQICADRSKHQITQLPSPSPPSSTAEAILPVNTDRPAAFRASPSDFFVFYKPSNPQSLNVSQVFDHAHGIFRPVSFIQMFQTCTWKALALEAISWFNVLKVFTIFDFASNARDGFINVSSSTTGTCILFSQISHANAAVHPARSDE